MEFRDSFSVREINRTAFGTQTVRLVCYRGNLSNPEWVDQDQCTFLESLPRVLVLIWTIVVSFSTHFFIHVDLSEAARDLVPKRQASGQVYYQLDYDVIIFFGLTELQAHLCWKTRVSCGSLRPAVC